MIKLDDGFSKLIDSEASCINTSIDEQNKLNNQVLICLKKITDNICIDEDTTNNIQISKEVLDVFKLIEKINFNISCYENLLKMLEEMKSQISLTDNKIINDIQLYNKKADTVSKKILSNVKKIEQFIKLYSNIEDVPIDTSVEGDSKSKDIDEENLQNIGNPTTEIEEITNIEENEYDVAQDEEVLIQDTLIISEIDGKVILPYTFNELGEVFKDNPGKYTSLKQIVDDLYTKPIKYYKNLATSRFREAYRLVRQRESGSVMKALDLATELFSNYNLHPAIITACKNMNELDIYLSCLEYNELDDFHLFKIKFITSPTISKKDVLQV